jgi:hypothetical protein
MNEKRADRDGNWGFRDNPLKAAKNSDSSHPIATFPFTNVR